MNKAPWRTAIESDLAAKNKAWRDKREDMGYKDRVVPMHPRIHRYLESLGDGDIELGCARAAVLAYICGFPKFDPPDLD